MNDFVLPSLVGSPPVPSPNNNVVDVLEESAETMGPEGFTSFSQSTSLPPNSASIVRGAFLPSSSISGMRIGGDILTVQQRFDTTRKKLHQLALSVKVREDTWGAQSFGNSRFVVDANTAITVFVAEGERSKRKGEDD